MKGLINFLEQQSDDCTKEISNLNALKCKIVINVKWNVRWSKQALWIIFQRIIINKSVNFLKYECFIKWVNIKIFSLKFRSIKCHLPIFGPNYRTLQECFCIKDYEIGITSDIVTKSPVGKPGRRGLIFE